MIMSDRPSLTGRFLRAGLAGAALAVALAACTSSAAKPRPPATPASSGAVNGPFAGITFHGEIYVSAQETHNLPTKWHITKYFYEHVTGVRNCAAAAQSGDAPDGAFEVPSAKAPDPQAVIDLSAFHGPGTYTPAVMGHDKSDMILVPQKAGEQQYKITTSGHGTSPGKEVMFLKPDGDGELVYSEAHLDGMAGSPAISGVILWDCIN
jgi:hypothetical protein